MFNFVEGDIVKLVDNRELYTKLNYQALKALGMTNEQIARYKYGYCVKNGGEYIVVNVFLHRIIMIENKLYNRYSPYYVSDEMGLELVKKSYRNR